MQVQPPLSVIAMRRSVSILGIVLASGTYVSGALVACGDAESPPNGSAKDGASPGDGGGGGGGGGATSDARTQGDAGDGGRSGDAGDGGRSGDGGDGGDLGEGGVVRAPPAEDCTPAPGHDCVRDISGYDDGFTTTMCAVVDRDGARGQVECWGGGWSKPTSDAFPLGGKVNRFRVGPVAIDDSNPFFEDSAALRPVRLVAPHVATKVVIGITSLCTLDQGGAVRCWGANDLGQRGDKSPSTTVSDWTRTPTLEAAITVSLDSWSACATTSAGLLCWGENYFGQLLLPGDLVVSPTVVPAVDFAVQQLQGSIGSWFASRPLAASAPLTTWGYDVGAPPSTGNIVTPRFVPNGRGVTGIFRFSVASGVILATTQSAPTSVFVWPEVFDFSFQGSGYLADGLRAPPPAEPTSDPVAIDFPEAVVDVNLASETNVSGEPGSFTACALLASGKIMCWGDNTQGQCGIAPSDPANSTYGTYKFITTPTQVPLPAGAAAAVQLATAGTATCARLADGALACWGKGEAVGAGNNAPEKVRTVKVYQFVPPTFVTEWQ